MHDHDPSLLRQLLAGVKEEHQRVRAQLVDVQELARAVTTEPGGVPWAELRRELMGLVIALVDHMAREEVQVTRVLRHEGAWGEVRVRVLQQEHADERERILQLARDVASADRATSWLVDDVRSLVERLITDMDGEESAILDVELARLERRSQPPTSQVTTCAEVMRSPVRWLSEADTASVAARVMREENVGFLVVCDRSGRLRGTITDRDLALHALDDAGGPGSTVGSFMTRDVVSCRTGDDLAAAELAMARHAKSRIVVVDDGDHVRGVISVADLVQEADPTRAASVLREIVRREVRISRPSSASPRRS